MTSPRNTRTNAADSAPGVDDGPAGVRSGAVDARPGGRTAVWIGVAVVLLVLLAIFIARPMSSRGGAGADGDGAMVRPGTTQGDIAASNVPGTADRQGANEPVATQAAR